MILPDVLSAHLLLIELQSTLRPKLSIVQVTLLLSIGGRWAF
jgi:hypothetical protein